MKTKSDLSSKVRYIELNNAFLEFYPNYYTGPVADTLFKLFHKSLKWQQDQIKIFGKTYDVPRLQAWYGDKGADYNYSGISLKPFPWTKELLEMKNQLLNVHGLEFNSVLANFYRSGQDSNGWHADNEKVLGKNPIIASLSFGETRIFKMKHRNDKNLKLDIPLTHGSLLIMKGETQHYWLHTIAKSKKVLEPRINLTFRRIIKPDDPDLS